MRARARATASGATFAAAMLGAAGSVATGGCGHTAAPHSAEPLAKDGLPVPHWKGVVPGYLTVHIVTRRLPNLGLVLVDGRGHTFYAFGADRRRAVTCTGRCTSLWHPLTLTSAQALDINPALDERLLGGDPGPHGRRVVTFGGWPLYTYAGDVRAGSANGQGAYSYGGRWYALTPSGSPIARLPRRTLSR